MDNSKRGFGEFGDMYNGIHAENAQLKAEMLTIKLKKLEFIVIKRLEFDF